MDRRAFFTGATGRVTPVRPPYSGDEIEFFDACTGCGDCIKACPTGLLTSGFMDRPQVDFAKGYCTFCGECATSCEAGAIAQTDQNQSNPWNLKARLADACLENKGVTCRACEFECGESAIRFRPALGGRTEVRIDEAKCTGCGECIGTCPQDALFIEPIKSKSSNSTVANISDTRSQEQKSSQNKESAQC